MIGSDHRDLRLSAPGPRVCIETYGCAYNVSDSETMAGVLENAGYTLADSAESADAVIVNSCTVKDRTFREFVKRVRALSALPSRPAIVIAGCIPRIREHAREFERFAQVGPDTLDEIPAVIAAALEGRSIVRVARKSSQRLALPRRRRNKAVEIVPISQGCLGSCTFCQTLIARGRLRSFSADSILRRIEEAVEQGVRQIWLTSQDAGAYGRDVGTSLPSLLQQVASLPGDFVVRLGMANPDFVKGFAGPLADVLRSPRFFRFLHIPVQSGSDSVLARMGRAYTAGEFLEITDAVRARLPEATLATDIIAGFPGETDADFDATVSLVRRIGTPVINRSRFSPRPGTKASRMEPLPAGIVSRRSKQLNALALDLARQALQRWVGWQGTVIVEETLRPGLVLARNDTYTPVIVEGPFESGARLQVRVVCVEDFHVCGIPVERTDAPEGFGHCALATAQADCTP
jgi:threonylcarbamoyladenosine tRNA methylthiotransferase CDKAL1